MTGHEWKEAVKVVPEEILDHLAKVVCRQNGCTDNASCAWCHDVAENVIGEYLLLKGK